MFIEDDKKFNNFIELFYSLPQNLQNFLIELIKQKT